MANVYEALHQYPKAAEEARLSGNELAMARIGAEAGNAQEARATLVRHLVPDGAALPDSPMDIAAVYVALGDRDEAFGWLDRGYKEHVPRMMYLKVDQRFATLRTDSRFTSLLARTHP